MYRPPENANRVKAIKSKFENSAVDTKSFTKAPLRKSKTLQDFNIRSVHTDTPQNKVQKFISDCNTDIDNRTQNTQTSLSRQLSDPAKRNIKRTPAFRLDRNVLSDKTGDQKNARLLHNKSRYSKLGKLDNVTQEANNENVNFKEYLSKTKINGIGQTKTINFSDIRNKFNGENQQNVSNKPTSINSNGDKNQDVTHQNKTDDSNKTEESVLKYLYSEPLPKSQRAKVDNKNEDVDVYNSSTLKLSESPKRVEHVSDDESHYSSRNFIRNTPAYGSLRAKKSHEDLPSLSNENGNGLTDTLKNALKKPLPSGPAPKKPPRTFLHSPNKPDSNSEISPLNLDKDFTKKLNTELQKNIGGKKTNKGDPKYMLDKLETVLKSKGILSRKPKPETTSEEDSDNEKNKLKFLNLRDLPNIPTTTSSQTLSNLFYNTTPETSPKFNFNCLTSLGCVTSTYEAVKEPNSSFFVTSKREEPVYAEPFEYQVDVERRVKTESNKDGAMDSNEGVSASMKTIRRSLHYAVSEIDFIVT